MIYGNFGAQSETIEVKSGSKHLGDIPVYNLLTLNPGNTIRFASKYWKIKKIKTDEILVEQTKGTNRPAQIRYLSKGIGFDPVLTENIWQLIHEYDNSSFPDIESSLQSKVKKYCNDLQKFGNDKQVPCSISADGVYYCTFAGYLVNKAVCLINGIHEFEINDIFVKHKTKISKFYK